jgi:UPF0755 protein
MLGNIKKPSVKKPSSARGWLLALIICVLVLFGGVWALRSWYSRNLQPVSSSSHAMVYFTVSSGETRSQIAKNLERAHLIRSAKAFENYVRSNEVNNLQAGTYVLSPSMSVSEIVAKISNGEVAKNLLTILPGKRLDQIKQEFMASGYTQAQVDVAFNPDLYSDLSIMSTLPAGANLEGYLYPDSFQKQSDTPAETIVRQSIQELQKYMTADVVNGLGAQGLNVYQGMTLASIVEKETSNPADQPTVAQVFLSRYKQGMMLGSDVTAFYGSESAGAGQQVFYESPYNTRLHTGLPPGPIGNFTYSALRAVAKPASTDYLYFVAGDDGTLHFSHTAAEHDAAVAEFCHKACSR